MASTRVELYLQSFLPELQYLLDLSLLSELEIRSLNQKRRQFEYQIINRNVRIIEFYHYLQFEINLNSLLTERRKRLRLPLTGNPLDYYPIRRVFFLFERMIKKFHSIPSVWIQFLQYAKRMKSNKKVSALLTKAMARHPHHIPIWLFATHHSFHSDGNIQAARSHLQRAIRLNSKEKKLFLYFFHMEIVFSIQNKQRRFVLGIEGKQNENQKGEENGEGEGFIDLRKIQKKINTPTQEELSASPSSSPFPSPSDSDSAIIHCVLPMAIFHHCFSSLQTAFPHRSSLKTLLFDFISLIPHPFNRQFSPLSHKQLFAQFFKLNFHDILQTEPSSFSSLSSSSSSSSPPHYTSPIDISSLLMIVINKLVSEFPEDSEALMRAAEIHSLLNHQKQKEKIKQKSHQNNIEVIEMGIVDFLLSHQKIHPNSPMILEFTIQTIMNTMKNIQIWISQIQTSSTLSSSSASLSNQSEYKSLIQSYNSLRNHLETLFESSEHQDFSPPSSSLIMKRIHFLSYFPSLSPSNDSSLQSLFSFIEKLNQSNPNLDGDIIIRICDLLWKKMEWNGNRENVKEVAKESKSEEFSPKKKSKKEISSKTPKGKGKNVISEGANHAMVDDDHHHKDHGDVSLSSLPHDENTFVTFLFSQFDKISKSFLENIHNIHNTQTQTTDSSATISPSSLSLSYSSHHFRDLLNIIFQFLQSRNPQRIEEFSSRLKSFVSALSFRIIESENPHMRNAQMVFKYSIQNIIGIPSSPSPYPSPLYFPLWDVIWSCRWKDPNTFHWVLCEEVRQIKKTFPYLSHSAITAMNTQSNGNGQGNAKKMSHEIQSVRRHFELSFESFQKEISSNSEVSSHVMDILLLWSSFEKSLDVRGVIASEVFKKGIKSFGGDAADKFTQKFKKI